MVREFWIDNSSTIEASPSENLIGKMSNLKSKVKEWKIQKKQSNCIELKKIEKELAEIADSMTAHSMPWSTRAWIWELENKAENFKD